MSALKRIVTAAALGTSLMTGACATNPMIVPLETQAEEATERAVRSKDLATNQGASQTFVREQTCVNVERGGMFGMFTSTERECSATKTTSITRLETAPQGSLGAFAAASSLRSPAGTGSIISQPLDIRPPVSVAAPALSY